MLKAKRSGRPKGDHLIPMHAAQIAKAVVDHSPDKLKLAFYLWMREEVRSDHAVGCPYGRRGKTPLIPGTGQRSGCNMIFAITNKRHRGFRFFKKRPCPEVFLDFPIGLLRISIISVYSLSRDIQSGAKS